MDLTFLGTRGGIEIRSRRHRLHSASLVEQGDVHIMINCGTDWLHRTLSRRARLCSRMRTPTTRRASSRELRVRSTRLRHWELLSRLPSRLPIRDRRTMPLRKAVVIGGIRFNAIPVQHSMRAPAVGYHVSANGCCFFYLPDVAELPKATDALRGIDVYIGDGATVKRSMVRR